jgi:hypothetical protein
MPEEEARNYGSYHTDWATATTTPLLLLFFPVSFIDDGIVFTMAVRWHVDGRPIATKYDEIHVKVVGACGGLLLVDVLAGLRCV